MSEGEGAAMKELSERIFNIVFGYKYEQSPSSADKAVEAIISSPTNLRAERECDHCEGEGKIAGDNYEIACPICKGKKALSRPLTLQEKLEIPDMLLDGRAVMSYKYEHLCIILPSGDRIVIARDKGE